MNGLDREEYNELYDQASEFRHSFEAEMLRRNMPAIAIRLGDTVTVAAKPVKNSDKGEESWQPDFVWNIQKGATEKERKSPFISAKTITNEERGKWGLPREYKQIGEDEIGLVFENDQSEKVGWVVIQEFGGNELKDIHLDFIGVKTDKEDKGYGRAILNWLKERYESISLAAVAYDLGGRGSSIAISRLKNFYIKNGFTHESGNYYWERSIPNLEDAKPGQILRVDDRFHANGKTFFQSDLMMVYLQTLKNNNQLNIFDPNTREHIIKWLELRKKMNGMVDNK